ncbi:MAG: MltA domain-containing protein [Elusimicrobia bacterium]|nr:MltA domain-containing protein [Elusimicrobiota bacterium]
MKILALVFLLWSEAPPSSAQPAPGPSVSTATAKGGPSLRLLEPEQYPDFADSFSSKNGLIKAARKTMAYLQTYSGPKYIRIGDRDYGAAILADSIQALLDILNTAVSSGEINAQIRQTFDVYQSEGSDGAGKVVFSSYYQPVLAASLKKTGKYSYPLYRRPSDMVEVELGLFDKKYGGDALIGRIEGSGKNKRVLPYFSRGEIDIRKRLAGRGLEIAWLKNKFDGLDLHIQGSGILQFPNGKEMLVKYAATNALPYNSVGLFLVKANVFGREEISHDKLRKYLREHPEVEDWLLAQNPRYTFFELAPLPPDGEPFGTIEQTLVPARSIAVDPAVIPLGALAFFATVSPQADKKGALLGQFANSRFALCMDTGGAIKGPGRVDIYAGHGPQASTTARYQWNEGKLYILVKKVPPRER